MRCWLLLLALIGACNAHLGGQDTHSTAPDGPAGGSDDGGTLADAAVMLGPWGTPTPVTGAASAGTNEDDPTLSTDGLELYYAVAQSGGGKNLYRMTRASRSDPFANTTALAAFNGGTANEGPRLAYDDLTIYWGEDGDIYSATRTSTTAAWTVIGKVPGVDTAAYEKWLAVCGDASHFVVSRDNGATGQDLYEGTLGAGPGTRIDAVSSTASEISSFVSKDCLTLYFASNRIASNNTQIFISTRTSIGAAWSTPVQAASPFDGGTDNEDAGYTPDQRLFVFATTRGNGTKDVYLTTR
ncbi:MAG: hypothetical protein ABI467_05615 [Kofleriaceae bacterium]